MNLRGWILVALAVAAAVVAVRADEPLPSALLASLLSGLALASFLAGRRR